MESHRDLRSVSKEFLRDKSSSYKWRYGSNNSHGTRLDLVTMEAVGGNEGQRVKVRPMGKYSDRSSHWETRAKAHHQNIVKPRCNNNWWSSPSRVRDIVYAREEVKDSLRRSVSELSTSGGLAQTTSPDDFTYSFDRLEGPNQPVVQEAFVKPTGRDTERLVQKEYEILDLSGEALKGRKARSDLRKPAGPSLVEIAREDDGFELV